MMEGALFCHAAVSRVYRDLEKRAAWFANQIIGNKTVPAARRQNRQ